MPQGINYGRPAVQAVAQNVGAVTAKAAVGLETVRKVVTLAQLVPGVSGTLQTLKRKGEQWVEATALGLLAVILEAIQGTEAYDRAVSAVADSIRQAIPGDQVVEPRIGRFLIDLGQKVGGYAQ